MFIRDAQIGTRIVFGTTDDVDIVWRKVSDAGDFFAETRIGSWPYDMTEYRNTSRARRSHGNNFFPHSNIFQWLNARGDNWFEKKHEFDIAPYYETISGFLSGFTDDELGAIVDRDITVSVPLGSRKEFGKTYNMTCKVCLPSASEVGFGEADVAEGAKLDEIERFIEGDRWSQVMTRTGFHDAGHIIVYYGSTADLAPSDHSSQVHPMIRISGDFEITDKPDNYGIHYAVQKDDEAFISGFMNVLTAS